MALHEGKLSGLMLVPEEFEFVDEVTDAILTDVTEDDARDSNMSTEAKELTILRECEVARGLARTTSSPARAERDSHISRLYLAKDLNCYIYS